MLWWTVWQLRSSDAHTRAMAVEKLRRAKKCPTSAVEPLLAIITGPDEELARHAHLALEPFFVRVRQRAIDDDMRAAENRVFDKAVAVLDAKRAREEAASAADGGRS